MDECTPPLFQNLILSAEIHLAQTLEELFFSLALALDNLQRGMDLEEEGEKERGANLAKIATEGEQQSFLKISYFH